MHEIQVDIRSLEQIQALLETLLSPGVESAPKLARDEQVLTLHDAPRNDVLKCLTNLVLVLVAESTVNMSVASLNGVDNGLLDLARSRLPCSETKGRDGSTSVEGDCGIHVGLGIEDAIWGSFKNEVGEGGIHCGLSGSPGICSGGEVAEQEAILRLALFLDAPAS